MKSATVHRTERGWAGHYICANRCRFRRNTLLECGDVRIVVSTVGLMENVLTGEGFATIGCQRHFETMAFHAENDGRYWDAVASREVNFVSPWAIAEVDADDRANDMHETVCAEIEAGLSLGSTYATT